MKPKVIIGSAHVHRAQRYTNKDPAPFLPFEESEPPRSVSVFYCVGALVVTLSLIAIAFATSLM